MSDSPLAEGLSALARFYVGDGTLHQALQRVSELTVIAVPGADLVGLTMTVEGRDRTAVFTDEASPEVDQAQYDTGEGPCLDAFHHQRIFRIESTAEDGPWPAFRKACAEHGIGSTLSLPLVANQKGVGALNLYSYREHAFPESEDAIGMAFASQAAIVLANAKAYWDARELSERLGDAMQSRAVIEQAKGMLMLIYRISGESAFELLKWRSQETNVKLRVLADQMLADFAELTYEELLPPRATFDHLLLTAHQRVEANEPTAKTAS
jgi:GAF domain-containing protein